MEFVPGEYVIHEGRLERVHAIGPATAVVENELGNKIATYPDRLRKVDLTGEHVIFQDRYVHKFKTGAVRASYPHGHSVTLDEDSMEPDYLWAGRFVRQGEFTLIGPWPEVTDG